MIYGKIGAGQEIVVHYSKQNLGPYRARALVDMYFNPGASSIYEVDLSRSDTGMDSARININFWNVYSLDAPELTAVLLDIIQPRKD